MADENIDYSPAPLNPNTDPEFGDLAAAQAAAAERAPDTQSPEDVQTGLDDALANMSQEEDTEPRVFGPEDVGVEPLTPEQQAQLEEEQALNREILRSQESSSAAAAEGATRSLARKQATLQSRYKQQGNSDWRVKLTLAQNADYLYAASDPGILKPLAATQGVIFPYMPTITTNYQANYDQYDLIHSNYRGIFYKNSRVGDVQLRGTFTAQDTKEAAYLLAVIHFFRSVTKMFYGQDAQRGTPPPLVYLYGLGQYQFSEHPCVVSTFNYTLPSDVDYIRATAPNNYGSNMLARRAGSQAAPGGSQFAGATRLLNALLPQGALPSFLQGDQVVQSVNNTELATYVPTKIEIDVTLIPVQTRSQVSKQFSLKQFARGDLIKGGFW